MAHGIQGDPAFFPSFRTLGIKAGGVRFAGTVGGSGPPLLLLHGFSETHVAGRQVAPVLARDHTLVIPDLPGYGASVPHAATPRWTKRRAGAALVEPMRSLGHNRLAVAGHDRGTRVGFRLVMDHPGTVTRFASLAVVPTVDALRLVHHRYARKNDHWFFLAQAADLPERLLSAASEAFLDQLFTTMDADSPDVVEPAARDAYRAAFLDPAVRQGMCEDYRAALEEDLALDEADSAAGAGWTAPYFCCGRAPQRPTVGPFRPESGRTGPPRSPA